MWHGTAAMQNSMIPQKKKELPYDPATPILNV